VITKTENIKTQILTEQDLDPYFGKLLLENILDEATGIKQTIIKGEFGRANVINSNRRVYPLDLMNKQIKQLQPKIEEGSVFMLVDHPTEGKPSIPKVGGIIQKLDINEDGIILGEAVLVDTEAGKDVKAILEAKGRVGISQRGGGKVMLSDFQGESALVVQDPYKLLSFDFVIGPSVETSGVNKVLHEDTDSDQLMETLKDLTLKDLKEHNKDVYESLKKELLEQLEPDIKTKIEEAVQELTEEAEKVEQEL